MINAGFNPLQIISEKTGKSIAQLKEEMSKGAISAEMVQQAFLDATAAGGKFYNMSENASKTINGQISMMQDAMDAVFNEIGTKTEGVIIKSIQTATKLIQSYETIGKVLVGLVTTYGAYRTAVLLVTSATKGQTIAELALTKARVVATAAQKALNAAMLTNPYVALTTVIAGMAASLLLLRDNTTAAEKAQERFSSQKETAAKKEQEHKNAINGLIETVRDDTKAMAEREAAMIALRNEYPSLFAQYDVESLKLADLIDLTKDLNEEMAKRKQASAQVAISRQEEVIESLKRLGVEEKRIKAEQEVLKKMQKDYLMNYSLPEYAASLKNMDADQLEKELGGAKHMASGSGVGIYEGMQADKEFYDSMVQAINSEIEARKAATQKLSEAYKNAETQYNTDLAAFEWAEKNKTKVTVEEYNKRKAAKEKSEKDFKAVGGDPKGKKDKDEVKTHNEQLAQQEKVLDAQKRSDKERARTAEDMENMVEQARINAMKEGAAKQRAQQALNNKKELQDLERQKEDYIEKVVEAEKAVFEAQEEQKAKNDKTYKKKAFDSETSRASVDTKAYDDAINYTRAKQIAQEDGFVKTLYDQYKSYEDKKKDMEKAYLNDIFELNLAYIESGDEKYVRSIEERNKAYIQALNKLESEYGTEDYKLIFGDPEKMTSETIDKALEAARKKMSQLDKDADPETFQALSEAIERLENARDNNPFQGWDTSVMGVAQRLHQIRNIRKDIKKYEDEGNTKAKEASEAELQKAKKDLTKALIGTGVAQFGDALTTAAASMREVAKASGDIHLEQQAEALEKAGGFISSVASGAASGGWVGAIIGGATSLMDMLVSSITKSKVVAAEAKKAYEDYLDELARTARTINEEDYETIFGLRTLDKVIDASEAAKKSWEAYQEVMERTNGDRRKPDFSKGLENMLNSEGKKLRDAYSEIFTWEKGPRGQYQVSGLDLEEALKLLEAYEGTEQAGANWYKALEEAVNALQDYKDNVKIVDDYLASLFSNVGGEIADAIMQGNDALEVLEDNAGQIFKSIAKDMIMSTLIGPEFIEKYKKMLREAMATGGAEDDAAVLSQFADELGGNIEAAAAQWEELKRIAEEKGIDMFGAEAESQQEASSKGYQTLSEDTGNELVGRALAQYESNLRMEEAMRLTKESVDIMAANQVQIRDIAAESRALIADSYLELQQIRENTGAIIKPIKEMNDKMDKIISGL